MEIEAEFKDLVKPTTFGTEYLTYVLWAITPEGRAVNLGEVLVGNNHRSKLDVTTDLQAFAMIVTAEPYYAVRQPSNAVIAENGFGPTQSEPVKPWTPSTSSSAMAATFPPDIISIRSY